MRGGYWYRLIEKLIILEPISLIALFASEFINGNGVYKSLLICIQSILFYPRGALWYIQALLFFLFLYSKIKKHLNIQGLRGTIVVGLLLYIFALLCNRYYFLNTEDTKNIVDYYLFVFVTARNGLFEAPLFVTIGFLLSKYKEQIIKHSKLISVLLVLSYFAYVVEVTVIMNYKGVDDNSIFIMSPIVCGLLVGFCLSYCNSRHSTVYLRNASTIIYLVHGPILTYTRYVYKYLFKESISTLQLSIIVFSILVMAIIIVLPMKNNALKRVLT